MTQRESSAFTVARRLNSSRYCLASVLLNTPFEFRFLYTMLAAVPWGGTVRRFDSPLGSSVTEIVVDFIVAGSAEGHEVRVLIRSTF